MAARFETLDSLAAMLADGRTSARELVEAALDNIAAMEPGGGPVFLYVDSEQARLGADYIDALRRAGRAPSRFAGIPFSIKDLFDQAGQVTKAGSVVLEGEPPAKRDALAIARLKQAGFIGLGRTNMSEFAYSGVGLNPHYGTPKSVFDRKTGRIPGGSSAGAGVSVGDGTCALGIGTDTGGSCRIPAAWNGVVGYKSSVGRVPLDGVYPLAKTFDTVGPLARSVQCAASADALMAGDWGGQIVRRGADTLRLGVLQHLMLDDLDSETGRVFEQTLMRLSRAGVQLVDVAFEELARLPDINASGGIGAVEAYALHGERIAVDGARYDPRVRVRIASGARITAPAYVQLEERRRELVAKTDLLMAGLDAFVMPTTPMAAPAIAALDDDRDYGRLNFLALRNTFAGNFLERCAISLPMNEPGRAPLGLMLMAPLMKDRELFSVALAVEQVLSAKS